MCLFDVSTTELKEIPDTDLVRSSCYIVLVIKYLLDMRYFIGV